jgi:hypothetical protein
VDGQRIELCISWRERPHLSLEGARLNLNVQRMAVDLRGAFDDYEQALRADSSLRDRFWQRAKERVMHVRNPAEAEAWRKLVFSEQATGTQMGAPARVASTLREPEGSKASASGGSFLAMNDKEEPARSEEQRTIDLSEQGQRGIDVRPTSDPQAVSAPPMGGLAPVEAAPDGEKGGGESPPSGQQGSGGANDSGE